MVIKLLALKWIPLLSFKVLGKWSKKMYCMFFSLFMNIYSLVDTQFCTHNLIKENDLNDQFMYHKNHNCITSINLFLHYMHHFFLCIICINSFIAYHKNDLEILMVATVFLVFKSDHRIKRYRMIKFVWSTCIVSR